MEELKKTVSGTKDDFEKDKKESKTKAGIFSENKETGLNETEVTPDEYTWNKTLDNFSQSYKNKTLKRKRSSINTTHNFANDNDEDFSELSKKDLINMNMNYIGMDEDEDVDDFFKRAKRRRKDDDTSFEMKFKKYNEVKYTPVKKPLENPLEFREIFTRLSKLTNLNLKSQSSSDVPEPALIPESNSYQHFISLIDSCLEDLEHVDLIQVMKDQSESHVPIPKDVVLSRESLQEMCNEITKLKATFSTKYVPIDKLSRINTLLMLNICGGAKIALNMAENDNEEAQNINSRDFALEKIGQSLDACFVVTNIMTSSEMSKEVFVEEVIESVVTCVKHQLCNLIFPEYDVAYRVLTNVKENQMSIKWKRAREKESLKPKSIVYFYNRLVDILSNLSELVFSEPLTDDVVLQLSSLAVSVFFVENINDLQLASLTLLTNIFSKYEKHRDLIIEDILGSLSRLPSSKKNLRNYRFNSEESIQMLTALSLSLFQSVVNSEESFIESSYTKAKEISFKILRTFLLKSTAKSEDDYRLIFDNFVTDLLVTVNKPEWPGAELMLNVLGSILTNQLVDDRSDQTTRVICIDYLGKIASSLRRDAVSSPTYDINIVIKNLITGSKSSEEEEDEDDPRNDTSLNDAGKLQILRDGVLDYLEADMIHPSAKCARQFYFGQWFTESLKDARSSQENLNNSTYASNDAYIYELAEDRRNHLLYKMCGTIVPDAGGITPSNIGIQLKGRLDYEDVCLVCRHFRSLKPFSQSCDRYLLLICGLLRETSVVIRTKAMRSLCAVVEADPSILCRQDIERSVHLRFFDPSMSVREAAVELVGKYLLTKPELIPQYYPMIAERILDKGTSVRKRVIRIFRDICVEHTDFPKIPEICIKMIRRINDEDSIKKLVNEVFQNMWFIPVKEKETAKLLQKVMNITDVVSACSDIGFEWFYQLLNNLLKMDDKEKVNLVENACKQIVDSLVMNIMRLEEISNHTNQKLVSFFATLHLFTKIRPKLMIHHVRTVEPYLGIRISTKNDMDILHHVARILEATVPLMEHPSETFINQVEEHIVKVILTGSRVVLESCVACLASTVIKISHNYPLVQDCFERYFNFLLKISLDKDFGKSVKDQKTPMISRALFTVGLLSKYFDFDNLRLANDINTKVFRTLMYFAEDYTQSCDIRMKAVSGLGFLSVRYRELVSGACLSRFYFDILLNRLDNVNLEHYPKLVGCILDNLSLFLIEEEERIQRLGSTWNHVKKGESLKEMDERSSGISSHVAQKYLDSILANVIQPWTDVRAKAVNLLVIIIRQGLINPIGSLPYLISAQTDPNTTNRIKADIELSEINKKFIGFISMKAVHGMRQSAMLQETLVMYKNSQSKHIPGIVRGVVDPNVEIPMALNHNLYSMLRINKQYRRSFLYGLLTIFGEMEPRLSLLTYVSDNLAQFPYQSQEEPLYVVHHIDLLVSSLGPNIIQQIQDQLFPESISNEGTDPNKPVKETDFFMNEDEEHRNILLQKMQNNPGSLKVIRWCIRSSRGCFLLLALKQYLRKLYSLTDAKIQNYSPSDNSKTWQRQLTRRSGVKFDPVSYLGLSEEDIVQENIYHRDGINDDSELYPNEGRILINKFLVLHQVVNTLDPLDISDDSNNEEFINYSTSNNSHQSSPDKAGHKRHLPSMINRSRCSSSSQSHHSTVLPRRSLRVIVHKLDISSIPIIPSHPQIYSDEDSYHQKIKRSRLSITPNTKSSIGSHSLKKSKPKYRSRLISCNT